MHFITSSVQGNISAVYKNNETEMEKWDKNKYRKSVTEKKRKQDSQNKPLFVCI